MWQNPSPSSPRYCRPIRGRFVRESNETTNDEITHVERQIEELSKSKYCASNGNLIFVNHTLRPTMVDAKVCNAATGTTSSMRCYICGATSKSFNDLENRKEEDPATFKFGLSTLHARIRFFELIIHLSYKLPLKKWQARHEEDKKVVADRKQQIQAEMQAKLGLLVDVPKAGSGNTNDGNTARRFFENVDVVAAITGVDKELIYRFKVIIETITCGLHVDTEKFSIYAIDTARIYVSLYGWHPMTPTVHKILVHGKSVMEHALLPIGLLSEEAAEARNKHFRAYRQNFSRKFSRTACNRDILNRLLLSSDPYLSSCRKKAARKSKPFSIETQQMLKEDDIMDDHDREMEHIQSDSDEEII